MKKFFNKFKIHSILIGLVSMLAVVLGGCANNKPIVESKITAIPEDNLLLDCKFHEPPAKEEFKALNSCTQREVVLADYSITLMKDAAICNERFKTLREWKKNVKETVAKANKK